MNIFIDAEEYRDRGENVLWGSFDHPGRANVNIVNRIYPELVRQTSNMFVEHIRAASRLAQVAHFDMLTYDQLTKNTRRRIEDNISNEKKIAALNIFSTLLHIGINHK